MARFAVVICGGGIAGIEALLRLRRLAGTAVDVTLLSPKRALVYRPLAVLEPFALGGARRYSIDRITSDAGARWLCDALAWVDRQGRTAHSAGGHELRYDALLLAVGGRQRATAEAMAVFTARAADHTYRDIVRDVETGGLRSLVLALPHRPSWPLPLYELALLTAQRAYDRNVPLDIAFVTAEPRPLHSFGGGAGDAVAELFADAGITLYTGSRVHVVGRGRVVLQPAGTELPADRTITVPTITGPNIRGLPGEALDRFLSVDEHCRVRDTDGRIFAAGDATDLPVKHGGLGAQQADTAAAAIAHLAGVAGPPDALRPVIRGTLLTGREPLYLAAHLIAGQGWRAEIYEQPPWPLDDKVVAEELGPDLAGMQPSTSSQ
jgi:sulfide:quinone oxidoreductase